jgi:hypothetical protein
VHPSRTNAAPPISELAYLAPEQVDRPSDSAADIFSLCHVLWRIVSGRRLVSGPHAFAILEAIRDCRIELPQVGSERFRELMRENLVADPAARMSAEALGKSLAALQ